MSTSTQNASPDSSADVASQQPKSLWQAILQATGELGLTPAQTRRLHERLETAKLPIDRIGRVAGKYRTKVMAGHSTAALEFKTDTQEALQEIEEKFGDFLTRDAYKKMPPNGFVRLSANPDIEKATAFILGVAIDHFFGDLVRGDGLTPELAARVTTALGRGNKEDRRNNLTLYHYQFTLERSREAMCLLAGKPSMLESARRHPVRAAGKLMLALALVFGAQSCGRGMVQHIREHAADLANERENPEIFMDMGNLDWARKFKGVDITNVEAVRAKFGDTIEINGMYTTPQAFVDRIAGAMNALEEVKYGNVPSSSHRERLEQQTGNQSGEQPAR